LLQRFFYYTNYQYYFSPILFTIFDGRALGNLLHKWLTTVHNLYFQSEKLPEFGPSLKLGNGKHGKEKMTGSGKKRKNKRMPET